MYKSAITPIITITLLLLVGIGAFLLVQDWTKSNFSEYLIENEAAGNVGDLEILGLKDTGDYTSVLGVRNTGSVAHNISFVNIGDEKCRVLNSKLVGNIQNLELNCNVKRLDTYSIDIVSDKGIYSKVTTVWEEDLNVDYKIPLKVSFDFGETCINSTRVYGMNYTNNSHAEVGSSSEYYYGACVSHDDYVIENNCFGNYVKLFSLAGISNSPIYINKNNAAPEPVANYYNWQDVCISSSGGIMDLVYSKIRPSDRNYICVGSFNQDDFNGAAIGGCSAYETKIWLDVN